MLRRLLVVGFSLALLVSSAAAALVLWRGSGTDMTVAANAFLATLDDKQRATAVLPYDDAGRVKWHFIPLAERKGLQIKHMNDEQRQAALRLLKSCLSEAGYKKASTIMSLEAILRELEKTRTNGPIRDPERYYWTVFGKPANEGTWGLSVEGHHMSLNFVVADGEMASFTPHMFGANPATVHEHVAGGPEKGTRILHGEEQLAFDLLASLDADQRKTAVIAAEAPKDVRGAGEPQPPQSAPEGIAAKDLKPEQVATLRALLASYLNNLPADVAALHTKAIEDAGIEKVYFAWAGADKPGVGHYYRVQGTTFLVEFCNVQPDAAGNVANHIHAVWRDLGGDFHLKAK